MDTCVAGTRQAEASGSLRGRTPRSHSAGLSSGTIVTRGFHNHVQQSPEAFPNSAGEALLAPLPAGRLAGPTPRLPTAPLRPPGARSHFLPPTPTPASWKAAGLHPQPLTLHLLKATTAPSHTHTPHPAFISRDNKASKANILSFTTKMWTLQGNEAIIIVKSRRLPWLRSTSKELLLV